MTDPYTPTTEEVRALYVEVTEGHREDDPDEEARGAEFDCMIAAVRAEGAAEATAGIASIIDRHPLNGRYGFTRDDVLHQLIAQAQMTHTEAVNSSARGAEKMMVKQETARFLADLAEAAIRALPPLSPQPDTTVKR